MDGRLNMGTAPTFGAIAPRADALLNPPPTDEPTARAVLNARVPGRALLSQEITRMLVCEEQRRVTHRETSGRLDRRALSRMAAGR
jgi:hypothetical protein